MTGSTRYAHWGNSGTDVNYFLIVLRLDLPVSTYILHCDQVQEPVCTLELIYAPMYMQTCTHMYAQSL